jgi:hypothetical protein
MIYKILKKLRHDTTQPVVAFIASYLVEHKQLTSYQRLSKPRLKQTLIKDFKSRMDRYLFVRCDWNIVSERIKRYDPNKK